jgi:[ribosomal protein S5]-alanine N-acetyltransferase
VYKLIDQMNITLRPTTLADLDILFRFQLDPEANQMAAFTAKDMDNQEAYISKYARFLDNPTINNQTILLDGQVVGSMAKFIMEGDAEITYWIDRSFWGRGVATKALAQFLIIETTRPLYARAAFDNTGSQRVLEKCGFIKMGEDKGFALARQAETVEYIFKLG